jgi:DNA ligase (NAD+)
LSEPKSPGVSQQSPDERLSWLRKEIRRHEDLYYIHDRPEVTDAEFDRLLHELEALEAQHPDLVTPDSPTQRVAGRPTESFPTVAHVAPMLSLDNAYDEEDLRAFDERLRRAGGLGETAKRQLRLFAPSQEREALMGLADYVLLRDR